jgi:hypothetical protein
MQVINWDYYSFKLNKVLPQRAQRPSALANAGKNTKATKVNPIKHTL